MVIMHETYVFLQFYLYINLVIIIEESHYLFSKAQNNLTKGNSSFMNGDRFSFVKPEIDPPLPEKVMVGPYECRVWYASRELRYKQCGEAHNTNDTQRCDYYTPPLENVIVFNSGPFSNFHRCDLNLGP